MKTIRLGLLIILAAAGAGQGDISTMDGRGETVWPVDNDQIEMVSEKVVITYQMKEDRFFADCLFILRNTGGPAEVMVGFPAFPSYTTSNPADTGSGDKQKYVPTILDFRVWIDGNEVHPVPKPGALPPIYNRHVSLEYSGAYVWTITFKARQNCVVRTTYTFGGFYYKTERGADYILRTGRHWKGPIGKADIIIQGLPAAYLGKIEPGGYACKGDTIVWHFENFEPDFDIYAEANVRCLIWIEQAETLVREHHTSRDTLLNKLAWYYYTQDYHRLDTSKIPQAQMAETKNRLLAKIPEGPLKDYFLYQDCLDKGDTAQAVTRWVSYIKASSKGEVKILINRWSFRDDPERFRAYPKRSDGFFPESLSEDSRRKINTALNSATGPYVRCLRIWENYHQGQKDMERLGGWTNLARSYRTVGQFKDAMRCYERALKGYSRLYKTSSVEEAINLYEMGETLLWSGDTTRAISYLEKAANNQSEYQGEKARELLERVRRPK